MTQNTNKNTNGDFNDDVQNGDVSIASTVHNIIGVQESPTIPQKTMTKFGVYDTDMQVLYDIFTEVGNLGEVWIFGSRARNSFKAKSDFDLCLVRKDRTQKIKIYDLEEKIEESDFWYAVDVKDYDEITNPVFGAEIHQDAILIWKDGDKHNDELKFVATSNATVTENLDFPHFPQILQNPYPIGWQEVRLGDVVEIIGGGTPKTTIKEYWNGGIPWLSVVDFNNDQRWVKKTEKTITELGLKNSSTKLLNKGELIISARGTVGVFAQLKNDMTFNQSCYGLRETKYTTNDFLYYVLRNYKSLFLQNVHGAVFDTITRDTFYKIEFPLPSLHEQVAIAGILSSLDDKIELLRDQNKTLEELGQKLFQKELAENGDSNFVNIKSVVDFVKGVETGSKHYLEAEKENSVMFYRVSDISNNGQSAKIFVNKDLVKGKTFIFDDILLSLDGTIGKVFVGGSGSYSSGLRKIKIINSEYSSGLIYFWLLLDSTQKTMKLHSQGAVILHAQNSLDYLEIPNDESFLKLSQAFQHLFSKILANTQQIQTLSKVRDTLLPQLMSGKVRGPMTN